MPDGWTVEPLGGLARVYSGGTPSRAIGAYWGGSIPWVTTAEIDAGCITAARQTITEAGLAASAARIAARGTILLAMYGQGKTRGKAALLEIPAAMNQACAAIEVGRQLNTSYLLQFLSFNYDRIRAMSNAGSQENLSGALVRRIPVVVPPVSEQVLIAEVLSDVDDLITSVTRLIAKKVDIRQGFMQVLLTGRTRLPGFEGEWTPRAVGELGVFLKGRGVKRDDVRGSGVPCVRYGEIYTAFDNYVSLVRSYVPSEIAATALPIQTGDILFAGSGETRDEIGKAIAYLGPASAVAGGDIVILRGSEFDPVFLGCALNAPVVVLQKARAGQGDAVVHISSRALAGVELDLPPREEQRAIARVLKDADDELLALRIRLSKAKAVKHGMMQKLLTGRTRLPVAESVDATDTDHAEAEAA